MNTFNEERRIFFDARYNLEGPENPFDIKFLRNEKNLRLLLSMNPWNTLPNRIIATTYDVIKTDHVTLQCCLVPKNGSHFIKGFFKKYFHDPTDDMRYYSLVENERGLAYYQTVIPHAQTPYVIATALAPREDCTVIGHLHNYPNDESNTKILTIIRNPIDRVVSGYFEMLKLRKDSLIFPTELITKYSDFYLHKEDPIKSFCLFLKMLKENGFYDVHLWPQWRFVCDKGFCYENMVDNNIKHVVSHNILFDNIETELQQIAEFYNMEYDLDKKLFKNNNLLLNEKEQILNFINNTPKIISFINPMKDCINQSITIPL